MLPLRTEPSRPSSAAGQRTLLIAYGDGPGGPGPVYRAFGFEPIGEVFDGEVVARLAL